MIPNSQLSNPISQSDLGNYFFRLALAADGKLYFVQINLTDAPNSSSETKIPATTALIDNNKLQISNESVGSTKVVQLLSDGNSNIRETTNASKKTIPMNWLEVDLKDGSDILQIITDNNGCLQKSNSTAITDADDKPIKISWVVSIINGSSANTVVIGYVQQVDIDKGIKPKNS